MKYEKGNGFERSRMRKFKNYKGSLSKRYDSRDSWRVTHMCRPQSYISTSDLEGETRRVYPTSFLSLSFSVKTLRGEDTTLTVNC